MRNPFLQIELPAILALLWLATSYAYGKSIRGSRRFAPGMSAGILYGFFFMLGLAYCIAWTRQIGALVRLQADYAWVAPALAWGATLVGVAWWRRRRRLPSSAHTPLRPRVAEALTTVGMLVCLVGVAVEWESIFSGHGRVFVGILWASCLAVVVLLARHRRGAVLTALSAFLGLLVIAAVAGGGVFALYAAGLVALTLVIFLKLWGKRPPAGGIDRPLH